MDKVNVREKLALISDYWNPRIVGELNGQHVKLVKFKGDFVWHNHADEDEFFLVLRGSFRMEFRDRTVSLSEGDFIIVPRGVEHRPVAENEVEVMLFEPSNIKHTGDIETDDGPQLRTDLSEAEVMRLHLDITASHCYGQIHADDHRSG
jgi:mannose-6-phosphate isomerase-like protein (cupin superfamily)